MLTIIFDGINVTPFREEYPAKTFSDPDVPHGTNSVYYKAASILTHNHNKNIFVPQFTDDDTLYMILSRINNIEAVDELVDPYASIIDQVEVLNPTEEEITEEFLKKNIFNENLYANRNAAKLSIIDVRKTKLATYYVNERIKQFLDVPDISDDWKAQFTTSDTKYRHHLNKK